MLPSQPQFCGITCLQQLGTELQKAARAGYEAGMSNVSQTGPSVRCRCCWWRNLAEANFEAPLSTASSDPQTGFIELCYNIPARSEAKVTALSLGTGHSAETGGDLSLMAAQDIICCELTWVWGCLWCLADSVCLRCYTDFQAKPMRVLRAFLLQEALLCPTDPQTFSRVPSCYLIPDFAQFSYSLNCLDTSKYIFHKVEKSQGKTRVFFSAHINSYHSRNIFSLHFSALLFNTQRYFKLQTSTLNFTNLFGRKKHIPLSSKQSI